MKALVGTAGLLLTSLPAYGQASFTTDSRVSMLLSWSDNGAGNGNNNGVLEPGETALVTMDVSFTNQFGVARFAPPIEGFSSGTILGYGAGFIDIRGVGGTQGTYNIQNTLANAAGTHGYGVRGGWRTTGSAGNGHANGTGIDTIPFGQFAPSPDMANSINPVTNMYGFLWNPATFAPRTVSFYIAGSPLADPHISSVYVDLGNGTGVTVYVTSEHLSLGDVNIPLVPAPSTASLALATFLFPRRRRPLNRKGAS